MGAKNSSYNRINIEKTIEVSDFWCHYRAFDHVTAQLVSILVGENSDDISCLKKLDENLKMLRHPHIVKYLTSWHTPATFNVMFEDVRPLVNVIYKNRHEITIEPLQISLGLLMVAKGLQFLHDQAKVSHNNLSISALYYASETNCWKIGSFQCACKFNDLNWQHYRDFVVKYRQNYQQFDKFENEELILKNSDKKFLIDCFSFGQLIIELTEQFEDFKNIRNACLDRFLNQDLECRTSIGIAEFFDWDYFRNDFLEIYQFLIELPIKSTEIKEQFYMTLLKRLQKFPEKIIAIDLGRLLLSRFMLMDKLVQEIFVPKLLLPRKDNSIDGLFSENIFREYFVSHLLKIFRVRVVEIRLLLLEHFDKYLYCISEDNLKHNVLPDILIGIKDENELLIEKSLHAIASLVPILGSAVVIGNSSKRSKIFKSYDETQKTSSLTLVKNENFITPEVEEWCDWNEDVDTVKKQLTIQTGEENYFADMEPTIIEENRVFIESAKGPLTDRLKLELDNINCEQTTGWDSE